MININLYYQIIIFLTLVYQFFSTFKGVLDFSKSKMEFYVFKQSKYF